MSYTKRFLDDMALARDIAEDAHDFILRLGPRGPKDEEWDLIVSELTESVAILNKYVVKMEAEEVLNG